jgi:hypothetical protein
MKGAERHESQDQSQGGADGLLISPWTFKAMGVHRPRLNSDEVGENPKSRKKVNAMKIKTNVKAGTGGNTIKMG